MREMSSWVNGQAILLRLRVGPGISIWVLELSRTIRYRRFWELHSAALPRARKRLNAVEL
jgi:hypothetical protein